MFWIKLMAMLLNVILNKSILEETSESSFLPQSFNTEHPYKTVTQFAKQSR